MTLNKKQARILFCGLFILSAVFYLFFYFHDGIVMSVDGPTYIEMDSDREPVYCAFLWLFRTLFGEDIYLHICVIIQCLLAGLAAAVLTGTLQKVFNLNYINTIIMLFIQYGLTILNRFVAKRRYSYYNSICTEALAYSFWAIFFADILNIIYKKEKKYIIRCLLWSVILISIRKHMLITYPILFVTVIGSYWKNIKWKSVALAMLSIIVSFASVILIDCSYNYATRGVFARHTGDSTFILGNEIYVADKDMVVNISSEENRELYLEILRRADELQYHMKYADKGIFNLENHYTDVYDRIKFDVNAAVIREYEQQELGLLDENERRIDFNNRVNEMTKDLLLPCFSGLLKIFWANVVHGFITTVLKVRAGLNELSIVVYLAFIAFTVVAWKEKLKAAPFATLVLFSIVVNVFLVAAALFSQMRYMLYNTGFFYQSGFIMLIELIEKKKGK